MSNFKTIFVIVFGAAAIFAILVFSGVITLGSSAASQTVQGTVNVWGTFDTNAMSGFITNFNNSNSKITIIYDQKDPATFDQDLIEAIAAGTPPDLILLPDDLVWRYQDKLTHIPFASLPAQTYQSTFISAADAFSASDGYVAVPWAADPLVMYYNRDLLQSVGLAQQPSTWPAFTNSVPLLAKKQPDLTLTQEAAAMGSYANIEHAKDILALLFFESNNQFITSGPEVPVFHFGNNAPGNDSTSSAQALGFYMGFSDPTNQDYSWNSGEPLDRQAFTQSSLAYYFGTASELPLVQSQNPNLNFGIALPPQASGVTPVTSGHVYGFAIPKSAPNQLLSYTAATMLSSAASESALTTTTGASLALIPVRRDVLAIKPANDPYISQLYDAALVQKSWIDPNPTLSDQVFSTVVGDVGSSTLSAGDALSKAAETFIALSAKI